METEVVVQERNNGFMFGEFGHSFVLASRLSIFRFFSLQVLLFSTHFRSLSLSL